MMCTVALLGTLALGSAERTVVMFDYGWYAAHTQIVSCCAVQ